MNKKELIARRNEILSRMDELTSMEDQTEATDNEFNDLDAELKTIDGKLDKLSRIDQAKAEGQKSTGRQATPSTSVEVVKEEKPFRTVGEELQAFKIAADPYSAGSAFMEKVNKHQMEIKAATGMSEGIPSDGGFLLSPEYTTEIRQKMMETGKLQSRCQNITIGESRNELVYPMLDETSRADGSRFGGMLSYWLAEAATKTATKPQFKTGRISLEKLAILTYATDELLQDATALTSWFGRNVPLEFGFKVDEAIVAGTGAGRPLGILNSAARVTVAKEGGQAADTLVAENVMKMYARHRNPGNAVWLINQNVWPQIFQFSLTVGTGGAPLFVPPGGLSQAPYGTLFGRPILPLEQCKTLGDEGDIILADLSNYLIVERGGIQAATSIHVQFVTDETAFRWVLRINGQPIDNSALTPFNTTDTISDFVTLAARA